MGKERSDGGDRGRTLELEREEEERQTPSLANPLLEADEVAGRGVEVPMEFQTRRITLARSLSSLRYRDFRLYSGGQIVSLIGTWMQIVAQNWLVLELTNSPLILGILSALQFLPILVLSVFGGVIADRMPKRQLLLLTQSASLVLALVLATLVQTGLVTIGSVLILAVLLGMVNAVDMPTRQAFVVELVGPADLRNAIALNSAVFNSARLVGPAVAGAAIGVIGIAGAFYLNAVSFVAAIGTLAAMQAGRLARGGPASSISQDLREGLAYVARTRAVWLTILLVALVGTFAMNLNVQVPVLARDVLGVGAAGYGLLSAASGAGSLIAALLLASLSRAPRTQSLLVSAAVAGVLEIGLAVARQFAVAAALLAGVGFALIYFTTLANTVIQTSSPDELRGRVMSVYATVFAGTTPIGSLFAGGLMEVSVGLSFAAGGIISLLSALLGYTLSSRSRE